MDLQTLLASICISGAHEKWDNTVERICDYGMHIADLLFKLRTVERSLYPCTDAKVILLPAEYIMSQVDVQQHLRRCSAKSQVLNCVYSYLRST